MTTRPEGADGVRTRAGRLAQNVAALLRARVLQAREETRGAVRRLVTGVLLGLIALALALLAVPLLIATLILALAQILPAWLAAAIILATMLVSSAALVVLARRRLRWTGPRVAANLRDDWQAIRRRLEERP